MNTTLILITLVIIIGNFVCLHLLRWVPRNKYKVGDYVYTRTAEGLLLARIDSIIWKSNTPDLVGDPTYNVYYISTEKHVRLPEDAIFCKFRGKELVEQ